MRERLRAAGLEGLRPDDERLLKEVAFQRAARRMYARILKERFGARDPRSMRIRQAIGAHIGPSSTTLQRPLNNLTRAVIGAVASVLSGGRPLPFPPYDEPLGLGWSMEALQLAQDAGRIIACEARLLEYTDPFAGSYCMESLTDEIENAAWEELEKIEKMGGAVAAIENGYMQREVSRSAYERQRAMERGERLVVGVNCFTGPLEQDVRINTDVEPTYDPARMATAEERQVAKLKALKRERDNKTAASCLNTLKDHAKDENRNLMPDICDCVENDCTLQEICDVMREVFGVYQQVKL